MGTMVHPVFVSSSMRGMGPRSASMSNLKLSGKLPKAAAKPCTLPPIMEPANESVFDGSFQGMQRESKSVPDLHSSRLDSSRGLSRESKDGSRRTADPFYDFLHGSPFKEPTIIGKVMESDMEVPKKVTKATIAEELRRLRQDDRDLKQGFRNLQAKSSMIRREGVLSGGVSLLQGDSDAKPTLARSYKSNVKLPSLRTANLELHKLQELMKKQHRQLGFMEDSREELQEDKDFRSAFRSLLK